MDILIDIQAAMGYLSDSTITQIARALGIPQVDVEQTVSFYHFFAREPRGKFTIYLNDSVVAKFNGCDEVAQALGTAAGCSSGGVSPDGLIGLFPTACIGMSDQEPAAIVNDVVFPRMTPEKARTLVAGLRAGKTVTELAGTDYGDGQNAHPLVRSMCGNNIRRRGRHGFRLSRACAALRRAVSMSSLEIIALVKSASVRGRGGAGFPRA